MDQQAMQPQRRFGCWHRLFIAVILVVGGVDLALYLVLQAWQTEAGVQMTRDIINVAAPRPRQQGKPTTIFLPLVYRGAASASNPLPSTLNSLPQTPNP